MKKGFKKTAIGDIPEEWEVFKIEEVFEFIKTKSLSRAQLTNEGGKFQYIHYGDIHTKFKYPLVDTEKEELPYILESIELNGDIDLLQEGDLIIADASEDLEGVGLCIELKNVKDKKVIGGLHTIVLRDRIGKFKNGFKSYLIKTPQVLSSIKRIATGASVLGITKGNLKQISVIIPPLLEQEKIASILSTVDEKIDNIEEQIAASRQLKKGMMKQLLAKGINHTEFKDSPLGKIPKSWEVVKLGEVLKIGSGRDYKHLSNGNIPVYGTGGYMTSVNDYLYDGESVGIGRKGTIDKPVFLKGKFWTVDTLFYTHSFNEVLPYYIYIVFQTINWRKHNEATGVPSLSKVIIEPIKIPKPPLPEQEQISTILSTIDEKLEIQQDKKAAYQELKKGLMQQLLTGKIRVNV